MALTDSQAEPSRDFPVEPAHAGIDPGLIKNLLLSYNPGGDCALIDRAYEFAKRAHAPQKRKSGEPYITHPVEVATILAEHRFDAHTLAAALLHDVIEDCGVTEEALKREFGEEIATLVAGVTKISAISPQTRQESQAENLRKMLVAIARDIRVLLIRLADRLHNMRTIGSLDPARVKRISRETLEIYAPLANRMGMSTIRAELEDLAFRHLLPEEYEEIRRNRDAIIGKRNEVMEDAKKILSEKLAFAGINAFVTSRIKEVYSLHKKMERQKRPVTEIFDLLAMRILVPSIKDCYGALGIVHNLWKPMPRRFKDYVAMPKPNMYQALHTTVIGPEKGPLEIQIKTHQMHLTAEEGIAAHWKYKSHGPVDERLGWLKQILEWQRDAMSAQEFMDSLRIDLFADQVYVLTPKGDIFELPAGSTAIDMAYHIHTEIGEHISGARMDNRIVPITASLQSGAVVEIITHPNAKPSRDWLDVVKTPRARQKIRYYLREKGAGELRKAGAASLQAHLDRSRIEVSVAQQDRALVEAAAKMDYKSVDALLEAIGFGTETPEAVVRNLGITPEPKKTKRKRPAPSGSSRGGVVIEGQRDLATRFGRCCNPVPGDPIVGYLSRGRGITVHRNGCPTIKGLESESHRFVSASWGGEGGRFVAGLKFEAGDRIGLLAAATQAIARHGGNIVSAEIKTGRDNFLVEVESVEQLEEIIRSLKEIDGIHNVSRAAR